MYRQMQTRTITMKLVYAGFVCLVVLFFLSAVYGQTESQTIDEIIQESASSSHQFDFMHDEHSQMITMELDMKFPLEQWIEIVRLNSSAPATRHKRKGIRFGRGGARWTGNTIPYDIAGGFSRTERSRIDAALQDWMRYTCLTFRPATYRDTNKIRFQNAGGCFSMVGMTGGTQTVGLARNCRIKRIIIHEVGHAIGFHHEQTRPDRDRYVTINYGNIPSGVRYNFQRYTTNVIDDRGVPYDYYSIMHYGGKAFSMNGGYTILTKNQRYQNVIGRQAGHSFNDIKLANKMYNCAARCTRRDSDCPDDGFVGKDCRCWCRGSPYRICGNGNGNGNGNTVTTARLVTVRPVTVRPTTSPVVRGCRDRNSQCAGWARRGECRNNPAYMLVYCKRSCNRCNGGARVSCQDMNRYCNYWSRSGHCGSPTYRNFMATNCRRSCNLCSASPNPVTTAAPTTTAPSTACRDYNDYCVSWARSGECSRNYAYMHQSCRLSCGLCSTRRTNAYSGYSLYRYYG